MRVGISGVTGNYYAQLGAAPSLGRLLVPADVNVAAADGRAVAVVSWSFWQRRFGGDPAIVGQSIQAQGLPLTIVGVAPRGFLGLAITIEPDLTIPITLFPRMLESETQMLHGTARWVATTGRLAPGVSLGTARAQIDAMWPALRDGVMPAALSSGQRDDYRSIRIDVASGARGIERGLRGRYAQPLYTLLAIAGTILLFATVNLGSLVFVRAEAARHEITVKLALGARRHGSSASRPGRAYSWA